MLLTCLAYLVGIKAMVLTAYLAGISCRHACENGQFCQMLTVPTVVQEELVELK